MKYSNSQQRWKHNVQTCLIVSLLVSKLSRLLKRKDFLQLQCSNLRPQQKIKYELGMTKALKGLELMLPAHVSPAKQYRTGMNGSKDNTSRLKWLLRGLHSVFGTQMDHPFGPLICFTDTYTQTHCKAHTHQVWLIQHGDPLLSAPRQLCLHGSSGKSICCYREP